MLALSLVCAAPVLAASAFDNLFNEYQSTGSIKACKHSTAELQAAKNQVPPDITQYAPDFPAAIQAALEARARGTCGGAAAAATVGGAGVPGSPSSATGGVAATAAVSGTAPGATPAPLGSQAQASPIATAALRAGGGGASSAPAPLIALAVLLIGLALAAIWWTVTTVRGGPQPAGMSSTGHAMGEVRLRAGGMLREFADWLRLGR